MTTQTHDIAGMCKEIADQQQEIARLQAQVDALAGALKQAATAIDGLQDSILGSRRIRTPDSDGWFSESVHADEMRAISDAHEAATTALAAIGR